MHKVIVVEDDRIIRRGLCQAIPWEKHGFFVAGEAADGAMALDLIKKEQPQVVVSDINMPFMSGLEMAKHVKEVSPDTKIIFLTGYEEFKYAQEAIKLKAFDYLLKPVTGEQLLEKAKEAVAEWEAKMLNEKRIHESLPLLQQSFFQRLAEEGDRQMDIEQELSDLGIQMAGPYYSVILLQYNKEGEKPGFKEQAVQLAETLAINLDSVVMDVSFNQFAIVLSLENNGDGTKAHLAQELLDFVNREANDPVTISYGRTYSNLFEIKNAFLESCLAMDLRHIMGTGRVISFEETVSRDEQQENEIVKLQIKIENEIKLGLPDKAKSTLERLKQAILDTKTVGLSDLRVLALKFSTMLFFEMEKWNEEQTESFNSSEMYQDIMRLQTLAGMMEILNKLIERWSVVMSKRKEKNNFSHVDQAIKYMKENYHDRGLTLQKLADVIHVSTPYLSNLFKVEKGFNFGDYLLELRMKKAMELLREGKVKTSEVSDKVGYSNPQYFSICFKKYTGYTPAEYRKSF
ncbi:response regulator [Neobacillus dielmonensis]|uniref:response regulator n=1 Tax=Neobacillus dielmonensis TaxID=1347369 RepID=UPI0005A99CDF|nr:response regulator [Neobacillus dielmonensis]